MVDSSVRGELGVAVAQFAPGTDRAANLAEMRLLAQTAVGRGAGIVVFPGGPSCYLVALNATTGAALGQGRLTAAVAKGPITYELVGLL